MSRMMILSKFGYGLNKSLVIGGILNNFIDSSRQANPRAWIETGYEKLKTIITLPV
jgi:hypothetical protein